MLQGFAAVDAEFGELLDEFYEVSVNGALVIGNFAVAAQVHAEGVDEGKEGFGFLQFEIGFEEEALGVEVVKDVGEFDRLQGAEGLSVCFLGKMEGGEAVTAGVFAEASSVAWFCYFGALWATLVSSQVFRK